MFAPTGNARNYACHLNLNIEVTYAKDGRLWEGRGPGMPGPYIVPCSYSTPLSLSYSTVQPSACKRAAVGVSAAVRT